MGVFSGRGMCCTAKYFQNMACDCICWKSLGYNCGARWSSLVARWAHNPKVGGSNPSRATRIPKPAFELAFLRLERPWSDHVRLCPEKLACCGVGLVQSAGSSGWVRRAQRSEVQILLAQPGSAKQAFELVCSFSLWLALQRSGNFRAIKREAGKIISKSAQLEKMGCSIAL